MQPPGRRDETTSVRVHCTRGAHAFCAPIGCDDSDQGMDEVDLGFLNWSHKALQVPWEPQIVMSEIGNVFALGTTQSFIVGAALRTNPLRQSEPVQARIANAADDLF